eukprot:PhM_4_TR8779/c0_g1_i1/m.10862/K00799/GST, gst; glutathione S-transferase
MSLDNQSSTTGKYVLGYWDIQGLATACRMALTYAGIPYEDKLYSCTLVDGNWKSEWGKTRRGMMDDKTHAFPNLPYLTLPDGVTTMVQSGAILRHIARVGDLYGATEAERLRVDEVLEELVDCRKEIVSAVYGDYDSLKQSLHEHTFTYFTEVLEKYLENNGTTFFAGNAVTVADIVAYDVMTIIDNMTEHSFLSKHPRLHAHHDALKADPKLAAYFSSDASKLPHNNKMAKWGNGPN